MFGGCFQCRYGVLCGKSALYDCYEYTTSGLANLILHQTIMEIHFITNWKGLRLWLTRMCGSELVFNAIVVFCVGKSAIFDCREYTTSGQAVLLWHQIIIGVQLVSNEKCL